MSRAVRVICLAGSLRKDSYNGRLAKLAGEAAAAAGGETTFLDLRDYPLPIFDEDLEKEGTPPAATALRKLFREADALLISSPEYNSSITPLLKNTIDWISRAEAPHPGLASFQRKVAGLLAASPGGLGGLRGLVHLRSILGNIGVLVLPEQLAVSTAHEAFLPDGSLKDAGKKATVDRIAQAVVNTARKLAGPG